MSEGILTNIKRCCETDEQDKPKSMKGSGDKNSRASNCQQQI